MVNFMPTKVLYNVDYFRQLEIDDFFKVNQVMITKLKEFALKDETSEFLMINAEVFEKAKKDYYFFSWRFNPLQCHINAAKKKAKILAKQAYVTELQRNVANRERMLKVASTITLGFNQIELNPLEGVFRVPGLKMKIEEYVEEGNLLEIEIENDTHVIAGVMKSVVRNLDPRLLSEKFLKLENKELFERINKLPKENKYVLKTLLLGLNKLSKKEKQTKMPASNLALVWGSNLFPNQPNAQNLKKIASLTEYLIVNVNELPL